MKEENEYSRDLQFMERRVEEWSNPVKARTVKTATCSGYRPTENETHDASSEFRKFLTTSGGHTGGWDEQDHLLFLRERRKYNGRQKFLQIVHSLLPGETKYSWSKDFNCKTDISQEAIQDHESWYQKYEQLKKEQKEAIKKWRATRQSSLDKQDSSAEDREPNPPKNYSAQRDITERIKEWKVSN